MCSGVPDTKTSAGRRMGNVRTECWYPFFMSTAAKAFDLPSKISWYKYSHLDYPACDRNVFEWIEKNIELRESMASIRGSINKNALVKPTEGDDGNVQDSVQPVTKRYMANPKSYDLPTDFPLLKNTPGVASVSDGESGKMMVDIFKTLHRVTGQFSAYFHYSLFHYIFVLVYGLSRTKYFIIKIFTV